MGHAGIEAYTQRHTGTYIYIQRQPYRQTSCHTDRQRQIDIHKQTDNHTYIQTYIQKESYIHKPTYINRQT